ncbi:MAG: hypothetical protein H0T89_22915 [Deltaproteobacteria bacterium]|nr:hypothetical protein [Deltaproteobacteria bacterium]
MGTSDRNSGSFTAIEEEFFRAGTSMSELPQRESFDDLDEGYRPTSVWRRLFARKNSDQ